jgi:hypothetical protein
MHQLKQLMTENKINQLKQLPNTSGTTLLRGDRVENQLPW